MVDLFTTFDWVVLFLPGAEATQDGGNIGKTIVEQDARRTGAGFFTGSGAVGDNPLSRVEFSQAFFEVGQWDGQCAWDMALCKGAGIAHIDENGFSVIQSGFAVSQANAGDFRESFFHRMLRF